MLAFISPRGRKPLAGLDCCAVEVMDSSVAAADGAGRGAAGTAEDSPARVDGGSIADEDLPHATLCFCAEVAIPDECVHDRGSAAGHAGGVGPEDSAALADDRRVGPGDQDMADASESEDECGGEAACLEACMTPSGQDYYLRRGGSPRRCSALHLSRIIARQQLLRRLSQGRHRDCSQICVGFSSEIK